MTPGGRVLRGLAGVSVVTAVHAAVNVRLLRTPAADPPPTAARVRVVVPARDEETELGGCLDALAAQTGVPQLQVVVVDDGSADGTAAVARAHGAAVLAATAPPAGWLGKPNACAQGAAGAEDVDVLVFVDADVRLAPHAVAAAVALLDAHGLDLVSPWPRQLAVTAAERLVQPLQQWLWATLLPLRVAERSPRPSLAAANGQFLVVRRSTYERAGGHGAVRGEVLEDIALLRAVKRAGGRGVVVDGSTLAATRMYDGWPALAAGYEKSLWAALGGSPAGSLAAAAVLTALFVLPPLTGSRAGVVGYLAGVAGRAVTAHRTGGRVWPDSLTHPLGVLALDLLLLRSVLGHRRGTLHWRGRTLDR
ncbi:Glycosyltransferase like family 2 [Klenkia soli]|uniref:Glycosyltransferase like family 2 n=1 Tax=Klenkia soli TaxID=1052260 RepID=A0A1H0MBJ9_9ACTN|nr:glycosyltransferase family A protein [Klenkia soli]SDO77868.1 Glycosyltransferase like family 2 [Klenkia soli]